MKPSELRAIREGLGLSAAGLAEALGLAKHGGRTVRRWEAGSLPISRRTELAVKALASDRLKQRSNVRSYLIKNPV